MAAKKKHGGDAIAVNRRARHDYDITHVYEAGLALTGTEVKSLREGHASIVESFATVRRGEVWLVQAHIPEYAFGNRANHDPLRQRKLLLNRREIADITRFLEQKGRTLVPMRLYWRDGMAKLEVGLGTGKARHDKRADLATRDAQRQIDRAIRERQRA